jgi:hypothetical protein
MPRVYWEMYGRRWHEDVFLMRYGRVPYHVLRGSQPMTDRDRAVILRVLQEFLEQEYASNPSRSEQ